MLKNYVKRKLMTEKHEKFGIWKIGNIAKLRNQIARTENLKIIKCENGNILYWKNEN